MKIGPVVHILAFAASVFFVPGASAAEKTPARSEDPSVRATSSTAEVKGAGYRTAAGSGDARIPVVLVHGTPYEMGWHLGRLTRDEMKQIIPKAVTHFRQSLNVTDQKLQDAWTRTAAFSDERFKQELAGLSDGSGVPLSLLQAAHAIPLLMPYSCSSVAAWGKATADGHLYQTRNLDWKLSAGMHDFPLVVVYLPGRGIPHVVPTFAGIVGAHTGMNARGIVLAQMGDSPAKEAPYDLDAPHFMVFFRSLLYDADSLGRALEIFQGLRHTKRYHYVFGDGRSEQRAVKIRAHTPEPADRRIVIWKDNDPQDEVAPRVLEQVVYNDEGRGAFPLLKRDYGSLNADKLIAIANHIPIRGGNVVNVVYDATALRLWVSYAKGDQEAYRRPYTRIDLKQLATLEGGTPDLQQVLGPKVMRNDSKVEAGVRGALQAVDAARMSKHLFYLAKDPLPCRKLNFTLPGHKQNTLYEADDYLAGRLESFGYKVEREGVRVQAFRRDTRKPKHAQYSRPMPEDPWYTAYNLYAERKGRSHPEEIIVVLAHKDSQSWIDSPGANDNAIGTVGVLEMARVLAKHAPERTIRFLLCNEEHTPWTSVTAAQNAKRRGDKIVAVFNLDGIGVKTAEDTAAGKKTNVTVYTEPAGERLAKLMGEVNERFAIGLEQRTAKRTAPGDDDGSFVAAGYPAAVINIGSWPYGDPNYHAEGDIPERCDVPNAARAVQATVAAVLVLDQDP